MQLQNILNKKIRIAIVLLCSSIGVSFAQVGTVSENSQEPEKAASSQLDVTANDNIQVNVAVYRYQGDKQASGLVDLDTMLNSYNLSDQALDKLILDISQQGDFKLIQKTSYLTKENTETVSEVKYFTPYHKAIEDDVASYGLLETGFALELLVNKRAKDDLWYLNYTTTTSSIINMRQAVLDNGRYRFIDLPDILNHSKSGSVGGYHANQNFFLNIGEYQSIDGEYVSHFAVFKVGFVEDNKSETNHEV
ncbi:hypothetical protein [Cysteiniphilum marinum]|uniref:hypothetical protein n=1 Tax=Cysteiniphilum marinum TaxID=2774191 RepID=UPI001939B3C5|nr:hypothetical protein [Cysteiniphilum marinum]